MKIKSIFITLLALISVFSLCSCTIDISADSQLGSAIVQAVSEAQGGEYSADASDLPQNNYEDTQAIYGGVESSVNETAEAPTVQEEQSSEAEFLETVPTKGFFTNEYGTPTTICAHRGCNMYIVSSGNSNCCRQHSSTCSQCGIFINEGETICEHCAADKSHL